MNPDVFYQLQEQVVKEHVKRIITIEQMAKAGITIVTN